MTTILTVALAAARGYLVVVALNGEDDKPDIKTLRAFISTTAQGISYDTAVWRECCGDVNIALFLTEFPPQITRSSRWRT